MFRQVVVLTSRHHKEACRCPFDSLVSPLFFEHKGPHKSNWSFLREIFVKEGTSSLGFHPQRTSFSFTMALTNHSDIKAHLFPAAFIVYQLLNLRITDSWRQIMHSDECTT